MTNAKCNGKRARFCDPLEHATYERDCTKLIKTTRIEREEIVVKMALSKYKIIAEDPSMLGKY